MMTLTGDSLLTALTIGIALAGYLAIWLMRTNPSVRHRAYFLNLLGIGFCAVQICITAPDPRWMAALLLNFVFQNIWLASPYTWTPLKK